MEFVCNLHMMGFFHLACGNRFMAAQTVVIHPFIRIEETGEELSLSCMTINA
jgi:hypothetical protein